MEPLVTDWIQAITAIVTGVFGLAGAIFAIVQVYQIKNQLSSATLTNVLTLEAEMNSRKAKLDDINNEIEKANLEGKLDKNAKKQRAYKVAILQCAAEDGRKEYAKLRKLWQMEAIQFKKLEKIYKNKAMARAKESMRKLGRSKSAPAAKAGTRGTNVLKGAKTLLGGGVNKSAKK